MGIIDPDDGTWEAVLALPVREGPRIPGIDGYQGSAGYMPPKGGQVQLSDDEVAAAVQYMVDNSAE